jgi:hypothetical protein
MILNLNDATEENGIYTWRTFPSFKFIPLIKTFSLPLGFVTFFKNTEQEVTQLIVAPDYKPCNYTFENDHLTMYFLESVYDRTKYIHPTELTVELIEAQSEVIEPVNA